MNRKLTLSTELARLASIVTSDSAIEIVEEIKVKDEKLPISTISEQVDDVINLVEDENEQVNPSVRVQEEEEKQTKREKIKETHIQAYRDNLTRNFDTMVTK